ncbi:MAG: hypothetical protein L3J50_08860 [Emcibacter sp.]|nr:hypothetical protein [Emcibacter sp.]
MSLKQIICGVVATMLTLFSQTSFSATYEYDALGRLTKVIYQGGSTVEYSYDAAGNRTQYTVAASSSSPSFAINDVSIIEGGTLTFTVTKTGSTTQSYNVNYATANGTALAGSDYTAKSGTLSFSTAQTSQTISVVTTQDTTIEPDETVYINLSGATSGAAISKSQGMGIILNDDVSSTIIAVNSAGVVQPPYTVETTTYNSGWFHFTITYLKDGAGTSVYIASSGATLCSGGNFIDPKYSFSGNGCEIIYQP